MRMKKFEKLLLCLLSYFCFTACDEIDEDIDDTRSTAENTIIMFFPWSNNLKSCFIQNISDFKQVLQQKGLDNERYVVCIESSHGKVDIIELKKSNASFVEDTLDRYSDPRFTTSEGITHLLDRLYPKFPSNTYSMTVGCHGTGWAPAGSFSTRSANVGSDETSVPETRFIGGTTTESQIEISTFKEGIKNSTISKFEMILFDNCYMANIEVAYELKDVCKYIVAYPTEVMAYGFPYQISGNYLIGGVDYENICESFYRFYVNYERPCGTISTINCDALDSLARFMKKVNLSLDATVHVDASSLQRLDGYTPTVFVDFEDYVYHLTEDASMLSEFDNLMSVLIPYKKNTPTYYTTMGGEMPIVKYSGITTSEPSEHSLMSAYKKTSWYMATHEN